MFPNLEAEMTRRRVSREDIAKLTKKNYATVCLKLTGKAPFTLNEAKLIKDKFFSDCDLEELFEREEN